MTVFCDWYFNECVYCVSTRFRVNILDCVREVVSGNVNINFVTFPD